jgi:hypothetical protein
MSVYVPKHLRALEWTTKFIDSVCIAFVLKTSSYMQLTSEFQVQVQHRVK